MRLKRYINEARVKTTNADVFLDEYAPIFMWSPKSGLLWSVYDKDNEKWEVYKGSKLKTKQNVIKGKFTTHRILLHIMKGGYEQDYIRGRISPNGKIIYIHSKYMRKHKEEVDIHYDRYVKKAVDAVYTYMGDYIS
jgi:hypothetical protein